MTEGQRMRVVAQAMAMQGVPFVHAGRTSRGVDCVGLLVVAARRAGMDPYDNPSYSPEVNADRMRAELDACCDRVPGGSCLRLGDILLLSIAGSAQHVALVSEAGRYGVRMVHAYQTVGRVVEHAVDASWARRLVAVYSWAGA